MNAVDAGRTTESLAREVTTLARDGAEGGAKWDAIQAELARRRLADHPARPFVRKPMRALILEILAATPDATPSAIADELKRSASAVSRVLLEMRNDGLVECSPDALDRRVRHYRVAARTDVGAAPDGAPSDLSREREFISLGIQAARRARRRESSRDYARDRLERLLGQASVLPGADDLALAARRELMITLRQGGNMSEWREHVDFLERVLLGQEASGDRALTPVQGVLDYELGQDTGKETNRRLLHFASAATAFQRCAMLPAAEDWAPREGWAFLGMSEIWRRRTQLGIALGFARDAAAVFRASDDNYGMAEAHRIAGFCQRLSGSFSKAIDTLRIAERHAEETQSRRSLCDIYLHLGESYRCVGDHSQARAILTHACEVARGIGSTHTLGFALAALAATEYEIGELETARTLCLESAQYLHNHPDGAALQARRYGVILRTMAENGAISLMTESHSAFTEARTRYRALKSPAGEVEALIGLARAGFYRSDPSGFDAAVREIPRNTVLALVHLDPWAPSLLRELRRDDPDLVTETALGLSGAEADTVDDIEMDDTPRQYSAEVGISIGGGEMAGEPRRYSAGLARAA